MAKKASIDQRDLTGIICARPQNFAWFKIIFASDERNVEIEVSAFDPGSDAANPKFKLSSRTIYAPASLAWGPSIRLERYALIRQEKFARRSTTPTCIK